MDEKSDTGSNARSKDWAGNVRTFVGFWGLPAAAMLAATLLEPPIRAAIWSTMLAWMGIACIVNARRCRRTHCRFTGPYLLLMAILVIAHAAGVVPMGTHGWTLLGSATIVGVAVLWWASERVWGVFSPRSGRRCN